MWATDTSVASPLSSTGSPTNTPACIGSQDTEMTHLLTSIDEDSSRSRSSSPKRETMNYNNNSRDRGDRHGPARPNSSTTGRSSMGNGQVWRRDESPYAGMGSSFQQQASYFNNNTYDPRNPMATDGYSVPPTPRNRGNSVMNGDGPVPLSTIVPGWAHPTPEQLDTAYAYAIRRQDGQYTRLIPADTLLDFDVATIQRRQASAENLIVLPPPRVVESSLRLGPEVMISREVVQALPSNRPSHCHTYQHHARPDLNDATQQQIDAIIAGQPQGPASSPPQSPAPGPAHYPQPYPQRRREKIYCDKWIHEGVCAFTQMGCKYRHEMPMDSATQQLLGLNHGLPTWYRRTYSISAQPTLPLPALPGPGGPSNRIEGPWRRLEAGHSEEGYNPESPTMQSHSNHTPTMRGGLGPIGPTQGPHNTFSNNPFSPLKIEEEIEEDDKVTYRGRGGQGPDSHHQ